MDRIFEFDKICVRHKKNRGGFYLQPICWVSLTAKNGWHVGWVEERNPTKDIGMLNPTYD
jgi:hypothetical protein